ncbi:MAG TPA: WYL domain-containing protein [Azospirillaceae bacterium]|nr:WYL domain-containing protein [Azospirillaceae bacterium]
MARIALTPLQLADEQYRRLLFIDRELFWQGQVTRRQIQAAFDVTEGTARNDLRAYRERYAPDLATNPSTGIYEASPDFEQSLEHPPNAEAYLAWLAGGPLVTPPSAVGSEWRDRIDVTPELERRKIEPICLQAILRALRDGKEIEVAYRSPHEPEARNVWIYPHALSNDTFRWSVRCWRYDHGRWGNLVLDRIEDVFDRGPDGDRRRDPPADRVGRDAEWNQLVPVRLGPNPGLSPSARQAVEEQYGMQDGERVLMVRQCQVVYFLKRYQLEEPTTQKAPHQAPLVVVNRDQVTAAIPPRMRIPPEPEA